MKKFVLSTFIIILVLVGVFVFYTYPRQVSQSINGVEYRLGTAQSDVIPIIIDINGKLSRSLKGNRTFIGTIHITGASIPNPDENRQLQIKFDNKGQGRMVYGYFESGTPFMHEYGIIFTNNDFSTFTIEEFVPEGNGSGGWMASNGLMMSGPASNRTQALNISNDLMKDVLRGYILK
ncbi:MAG: hypothetical protein JWN30_1444 [Bacilli bacterium]|nr:hypothetical protein [Bacilli bacterium]